MRVIGLGFGRGVRLYFECREGCKVKSWFRGGEVGTGRGKCFEFRLGGDGKINSIDVGK